MSAISRAARHGCITAAVLGLVALGAGACDFINPTNVDNPTTTDEDLANADNPTAALMPGLRAQFARMISAYVVATAVVSDDYSIHGTGIDVTFDEPPPGDAPPGQFDGNKRERGLLERAGTACSG